MSLRECSSRSARSWNPSACSPGWQGWSWDSASARPSFFWGVAVAVSVTSTYGFGHVKFCFPTAMPPCGSTFNLAMQPFWEAPSILQCSLVERFSILPELAIAMETVRTVGVNQIKPLSQRFFQTVSRCYWSHHLIDVAIMALSVHLWLFWCPLRVSSGSLILCRWRNSVCPRAIHIILVFVWRPLSRSHLTVACRIAWGTFGRTNNGNLVKTSHFGKRPGPTWKVDWTFEQDFFKQIWIGFCVDRKFDHRQIDALCDSSY